MTRRLFLAATSVALLLAPEANATKLSGIATGGTVNSGTDQAVAVRNGTTDVLVNLAPSAATDTTNAGNITGGKLATAVGGTGATSLGTTLTNAGNVLNVTQPINPQTGTTYTVASTDSGSIVTFNNSAGVAVTLPQATTAGFTAGFSFYAQNLGRGAVSITSTVSTINGSASLLIPQNTGCQVTSDGANFQTSSCTSLNSTVATGARQPVCIRGNLPSDLGLTAGTASQMRGRNVYFCPQGAKTISLMYAGVWANTTAETDLVDPIPLSIGIEVPGGTAGGTLSTAPIPVTCKGQRPCMLDTSINTSGATVTQGYLITDPIPVNVPVGGYIAVRTYVGQSAGQKIAWGLYNSYPLGESCSGFSSASDNSVTTSVPAAHASGCITPTAILGIPKNPVTSVCIVGDSISSGYVVHGLNTVALSSGGTGYVSGDVGKILTVPGGTTNGIAIPAQVVITAVSAGAVTGVDLYNQGSYNTGSEPTSPQTPTGSTAGSGMAITLTTGGSYDFGDAYGDKGYIQRALGPTVPYAAFTRTGDTLQGWVNRDRSRLAMIAAAGCRDAIVELGVNDRSSGATTMEANAKILWQQLASLGLNVYQDTITPVDSSTDGFATTTNQTQDANEAAVNTFNDDLRANYATWGLSGEFDVSTAVSTGLDSGLWAVNGTIGYSTIDGVHPEGQGILNAVTAINVSTLK